MIDWIAFVVVFAASLTGACVVVSAYALGVRLLTISGRTPVVPPADFPEAIAVRSPEKARRRAERAARAAARSPLTEAQKQLAYAGAIVCFAVSGLAVLVGIWLIVPALNGLG